MKLLTTHYYRGGARSVNTLERLLQPDAALAKRLERLRQIGRDHRIAYRFNE